MPLVQKENHRVSTQLSPIPNLESVHEASPNCCFYSDSDESEVVLHSDDAFAPVMYMRFKKLHLEEKAEDELDPMWKLDLNLCPTWEADSTTKAIETIVLLKQDEQMDDSKIPTFNINETTGHDNKDSDTPLLEYHSRYLSHKGEVVCAIGATTAYDIDSVEQQRHMSIAEETTACLRNIQGKILFANESFVRIGASPSNSITYQCCSSTCENRTLLDRGCLHASFCLQHGRFWSREWSIQEFLWRQPTATCLRRRFAPRTHPYSSELYSYPERGYHASETNASRSGHVLLGPSKHWTLLTGDRGED